MHITEITAYHVCIPFLRSVRHASHSRTDTDSLIVRCCLSNGTIGWGEGLPREYVTGETIDAAWRILQSTHLPQSLGGEWAGLAGAIAKVEQLQLTRPAPDERDCFGNSVRCAIELSVLDAACRAERLPLSAVTALLPESADIRTSLSQVRYSAAFTATGLLKQIVRALVFRFYGFRVAKVKTGVQGVNDEALLARYRFLLGSDFDLRIDANEAWTCENLQQKLAPLLPYRITSVEQPVPHEHVSGLAGLRGRIGDAADAGRIPVQPGRCPSARSNRACATWSTVDCPNAADSGTRCASPHWLLRRDWDTSLAARSVKRASCPPQADTSPHPWRTFVIWKEASTDCWSEND